MRLALAITVLAVGSVAAQAPFPPPGQLVDVGGYRVHLYCTGEGGPAVVIVGAGFSFDRALVQPEVAKSTRVCTYDVSGTGWSDAGPALNCAARVDEIHKALNKGGVRGPYVLVGLSIGGLMERLYASEYPGEVAGMVMVDHALLDVAPEVRAAHSLEGLDSPPELISKTPITFTVEESSEFGHLPERSRVLHRWAMSLNPALATVEAAEDCVARVGGARLGDIPLVVVSTGNDNPRYRKLQNELLGFRGGVSR